MHRSNQNIYYTVKQAQGISSRVPVWINNVKSDFYVNAM